MRADPHAGSSSMPITITTNEGFKIGRATEVFSVLLGLMRVNYFGAIGIVADSEVEIIERALLCRASIFLLISAMTGPK